MFKQQPYPTSETDNQKKYLKTRGDSSNSNRGQTHGIRVVGLASEQNRLKLNIKSKIEPTSPHLNQKQPQQYVHRIGNNRGIHVISSRQSSNERPSATSRSHERQKQSRQIKSQTNISQFESYEGSKDASIQKKSHFNQEKYNYCKIFEQKFKEAIFKQNSIHQFQINQLKDIINDNQQRIQNLIETLNQLAERGERKQKIIQKLQERVKALENYDDQCYEYSLRRCENLQLIFRLITSQLQTNSTYKIKVQNKIEYIETIIKDIFIVQKHSLNHQQNMLDIELNNIMKKIGLYQTKLFNVAEINAKINSNRLKQNKLQDYLGEMKQFIKAHQYDRNYSVEEQISDNPDFFMQKNQQLKVKVKLSSIQKQINLLQQAKSQLTEAYQYNQQKAKKAIWQLSNLLNKNQRELQQRNKQNQSLIKYNREIENQLIESKLKMSNMKIELDSQLYSLQKSSNNEQLQKVAKERQIYKYKYEQMYRHNQFIQQMNGKNNLKLIQTERITQEKQNKIIKLEKQLKILKTDKQSIKVEVETIIQQRNQIRNQHLQLKKLNDNLKQTIQAQIKQLNILKRQNQIQTTKISQNYRLLSIKDQQLNLIRKQLNETKIKLSQKSTVAQLSKQKQFKQQINELKSSLSQKMKMINQLSCVNQQLQKINKSIENEYSKLYKQSIELRHSFDQQEQYSSHLEGQNQKLTKQLAEFTIQLEKQSKTFKNIIERLKHQNSLLVQKYKNNSFYAKPSQQTGENVSLNYSYDEKLSSQKTNSHQILSVNQSIQNKKNEFNTQNKTLSSLKKSLQTLGFQFPVVCQIDGTGYLKHHDNGTFIVDQNENLFDLSKAQIQFALRSKLIQLFQ